MTKEKKMHAETSTAPARYHAARGVALVAAVFSAIVCVLLIASWLQTRSVDPLDSPPLQALMDDLQQDPSRVQLRDQIRALDLLARKAYFTSRWQLRTGGLLLLGSVAVLLLAIKVMADARRKLPQVALTDKPEGSWLLAARSRRWVTASGGALFCLSMIVAVVSYSELSSTAPFTASGAKGGAATAEQLRASWPNFRGPSGNAVATTAKAPTSWDVKTGKGIKWKVAVPLPGNSSPMVWGGKVIVTGADKQKREIYSFDADSGKLLWRSEVQGIPGSPDTAPRVHKDTGFAASTTATDGNHIFAIFANGDLIALDLEGKKKWAKAFGIPKNNFGHASSLITHENLLIVQWDQIKDGQLLGLNAATGEVVWKAQRSQISWSSPICVDTGSGHQLILTDHSTVTAYNPKTGVKLWSHECLAGDMGPSAAYADGWVFAANDYAVAVGIKLTGKGSEIAWESDEHLPDTASPVATKDHVFMAMSWGLACLDAKSGEMLWEEELDAGFYSSPIIVGDKVYAADMDGVVHIFQAAGTYKSLGEVAMGEPVVATPAYVDGKIYLRTEKSLFCVTG